MDSSCVHPRRRAVTRLAPIACSILAAFAGWFALLLLLAPSSAAAQEDKEGAVIVQFDAAAQIIRPFTFTGALSGLDVLARSGLDVITAATSFGPAVCSIEGVGCPATDCFCSATHYWAYQAWDGAAWQPYPVGAGSSVISLTGAVEGWYWGAFGAIPAPATPALAAGKALRWLEAQQKSDGGYGGAGATVETLLAAGANRLAPGAWRVGDGGQPLAAAMLRDLPVYMRSGAAAAGKSAVALAAGGFCAPPTLALPKTFYDPAKAVYSIQSGPNAWALLGALAVGETVPPAAVDGLINQAHASGGWEWAPGWGADTNATALALQALLRAGEPVTATAIVSGLAYIQSAQNSDGGFAYALAGSSPGASDANSTAYVLQALAAAGEDPRGARWTAGGRSPLDYLLSLQAADGSFAWQAGGGPNLLATQQVIPALLGRPQPLDRPSGPAAGQAAGQEAGPEAELAACPAVFLPGVQR